MIKIKSNKELTLIKSKGIVTIDFSLSQISYENNDRIYQLRLRCKSEIKDVFKTISEKDFDEMAKKSTVDISDKSTKNLNLLAQDILLQVIKKECADSYDFPKSNPEDWKIVSINENKTTESIEDDSVVEPKN